VSEDQLGLFENPVVLVSGCDEWAKSTLQLDGVSGQVLAKIIAVLIVYSTPQILED
jgi:hypothetical protein